MIKFVPKLDTHRIYDVHLFGDQLSENYLVVKSLTARNHLFFFNFMLPQLTVIMFDIIYFGIKFLKAKTDSVIIFREFWLPHLIIISLLNVNGKTVYFNINHELNKLIKSPLKTRIIIFFMKNSQKLLWLEGKVEFVPDLLNNFVKVKPMSVVQKSQKSRTDQVRIGIAGALRAEKEIEGALSEINKINFLNFHGEVIFQVGIPLGDILSLKEQFPNISFKDTSSDHSYHAFIKNCDVIIFNFKHSDYWLRHSGVLIDAISHQCVPIVPNLPLLASLVTEPQIIGVVREQDESIEMAIEKAINLLNDPKASYKWEQFFKNREPYFTF